MDTDDIRLISMPITWHWRKTRRVWEGKGLDKISKNGLLWPCRVSGLVCLNCIVTAYGNKLPAKGWAPMWYDNAVPWESIPSVEPFVILRDPAQADQCEVRGTFWYQDGDTIHNASLEKLQPAEQQEG